MSISPAVLPHSVATSAGGGWKARLDLQFSRVNDCTKLVSSVHCGPLRVQRPFYPEGKEYSHVYVLHPPGGVVAGDELDLNVAIGESAHVLLTTPGAGKLYRSEGGSACLRQSLRVAAGGSLEWMPQETIVFDGARAHAHSRIDLYGDAVFLGWELYCFGRPRAAERFVQGAVQTGLQLWRDDVPVWIDQGRFTGRRDCAHNILSAPWGLHGRPVLGTFLATAFTRTVAEQLLGDVCELLKTCEHSLQGEYWGTGTACVVTVVDEVLVCRYMGHCTEQARQLFGMLWALLRPALLARQACRPRVWNT